MPEFTRPSCALGRRGRRQRIGGIYRYEEIASDAGARTASAQHTAVQRWEGDYPIVPADLPIQVSVALGDQGDAAAGLCTESIFSSGACTFNAAGTTMTCRE